MIKKWLPVFAIMFVIYSISSLEGVVVDDLGLGKESYHIGGHFWLFLALGISLYNATKSFVYTLVIGILYGITDEIHQIFVPGRSAGLFDVLVDSTGIVVSLGVVWLSVQLKIQKNLHKK